MKLLEKVRSKQDKTIKYIFQLKDKLITEVSYIDNNTAKDIICISCQTGCNLGCRFCHTADGVGKIEVRNLDKGEMFRVLEHVFHDLKLGKRLLLVSYMGCGEPLLNWDHVVDSMSDVHRNIKDSRFAISTLIPKTNWLDFFSLTEAIKTYKLNVKIHLSLHFTKDYMRRDWMPAALDIGPSLTALQFYKEVTGNSIEIHYALIEGENDSIQDAHDLAHWIAGRNIPVKVLKYNTRPCLDYLASQNITNFRKELDKLGIQNEYYVPPGLDIGSSCGQFLLDYYFKYNVQK